MAKWLKSGRHDRNRIRALDQLRGTGDQARDARHWPEAEAAYGAFLGLAPDDFGIWVQLGHVLKESGRWDAAAGAYGTARDLKPDDPDLCLQLGHLSKLRKDVEGARTHYRDSFDLDRNPIAERELADLDAWWASAGPHGAASIGRIESVRDMTVTGWAIDPSSPEEPAGLSFVTEDGRRVGTAVAHLDHGEVEEASRSARKAGFETRLRIDVPRDGKVRVRAHLARDGQELAGSPFEIGGGVAAPHDAKRRVTDVRLAVAKPLERPSGAETVLLVTLSTDGVVRPHVLPLLREFDRAGISILLIVVADRPVLIADEIAELSAGLVVRDNAGFDFAAWAQALLLFPEVWDSSILYFVNDSMFGPNDPTTFGRIVERVRNDPADLVGLTETHEHGWHLQSYFLAAKQKLLGSFVLHLFFRGVEVLASKDDVIRLYEIPLTGVVVRSGFRVKALFSSLEPRNPTMYGWRELVGQGFPFVKLLLFRERFPDIDMTGWRDIVGRAGFDVGLLEATLRHKGVTGSVEPDFPLLVQAPPSVTKARGALKVAFYGPWNYDNGLGLASRSIIAALRGTGVLLNLHPVKKPFHIHRALVPPHDLVDFEGPADVAIVHLNPEAWGLLLPEQQSAIRRARKRIGYWVWEMGHIPASWKEHYFNVDRIWAPSRYCADVFSAYAEIPVDVVPHPVPLPQGVPDQAGVAAIRKELGLPATAKIILFVFDGASYLVRKNPHALIRAFAASRLAAAGWTLVLKTKNLFDRPEDGLALQQLASEVPGVHLVNRALSPAAMVTLMNASEIYASPHCSEGFGLTIAEAMAAGRSVVATDFGGSQDFLDATCGYPVPARRIRLTEDFGHYTSGGEWAVIDEDKLAHLLVKAVNDVRVGDTGRRKAARERVGTQLSYAAVGELIRASLASLFDDERPVPDTPELTGVRSRSGMPVKHAVQSDNFMVIPLVDGGFRPVQGNILDRVGNSREIWAVFAQETAQLAPALSQLVEAAAATRPDIAIFYGDDVALGEGGLLNQLRLKPSFDMTLLVAQGYIGTPVIVRGSALHQLGGLDEARGEAALDDLIVRAWTAGMAIERIAEVLLVHPGVRPVVSSSDRRDMLVANPAFDAYRIEGGATDGLLRLDRRLDKAAPHVTLLVPTRQSRTPDGLILVERLLDSLASTDWPMSRLHVIVADDVAGEPAWMATRRPFEVIRTETPRAEGDPFNFARKMNDLWRQASSDYLVFMNDDVVATEPGWLKALMTFCMDESVGAVGPRLLYDDGTIQHLGIVGGLFGACGHAWLGRSSSQNSYQDWMLVHREWSMVTGAVLATRRDMLAHVNGFDEAFSLEFNDLDLCLRIRMAGYRIVCTPHATLTHSEKASRGDSLPPGEEVARFLSRWGVWLERDPAFHPRMRRDRFDLQPAITGSEWFW